MSGSALSRRRKGISYSKWGYFFILPFFIIYFLFQFYPLFYTIYISFFENFRSGLKIIGPNWVGFDNYKAIFQEDLLKYFGNTMAIWLVGFIPQIALALVFASWFTDLRLKLKATGFFKVVIYLPNIIMASSIAVLFFNLFSDKGPINSLLAILTNNQDFFKYPTVFITRPFTEVWGTRGIAAFINFLMWYGQTTIILMAGIMGVDPSLYESAQIDGANAGQTFRKITLPLIKPILLFTLVTSLIGGIQMFDIPQLLTNGQGNPSQTSTTMVMFIYNNLFNKNYGKAGAISVVLFVVSAILSLIIFYLLRDEKQPKVKSNKKGGLGNELF